MNYCFCILGWHFFEDFYEKLLSIPGDKYILCHRDEAYFINARHFYGKIKPYLIYCENKGLEWGGYHQFNAMRLHEGYDFVIYCHDDLVIKDAGFVPAIMERFRTPQLKVLGNGRNGTDTEFRFEKYKECLFFPDVDDFVVRTVRGSFLAVKTEIFAAIGNFPVYWKAKKMTHGNISLRNFGYLVTKHYGRESIDYLDAESHLETRYLIELRRGEGM